MNTWMWLVIWIIGLAFPIPHKKGFALTLFNIVFRIVYFILGFGLYYWALQTQTTDLYQILWFIMAKAATTGFEYLIIRVTDVFDDLENLDKVLLNIFAVIAIILFAGTPAYCFLYQFNQGTVNNASYFDSLLNKMPPGTLPFTETIPDNMVRVVTEELAVSITKQSMSTFGSGKAILSTDITKYEGRLVWSSLIGSSNAWTDPTTYGMVIIDAMDPLAQPIIVKDVQFAKAEGLSYWPGLKVDQIQGHIWLSGDTSNVIGRAYITMDDIGNWRYVVTTYNQRLDFVREYEGVYVYDNKGQLVEYYPPDKIPSWITQPYDEQSFLEGGISDWGTKKRGEGFHIWAEGFWVFASPSPDRVQMTEDTRYIIDPESEDVIALAMVHPAGNDRALAGVFKATRQGIYYYDLRDLNLISGTTAEDIIEGELTAREKGALYGTMPLLYNIEGRLCWYVPIYWAEEGEKEAAKGTITFQGLGIIDAANQTKFHIEYRKEGMPTEQLVRRARLIFLGRAVEGELDPKTLDIKKLFEDRGITVDTATDINAHVSYNVGTAIYTQPSEWNATKTVVENFIASYPDQTKVLMWVKDEVVNFGFLKNKDGIIEAYYISIELESQST